MKGEKTGFFRVSDKFDLLGRWDSTGLNAASDPIGRGFRSAFLEPRKNDTAKGGIQRVTPRTSKGDKNPCQENESSAIWNLIVRGGYPVGGRRMAITTNPESERDSRWPMPYRDVPDYNAPLL